MHSEINKKTDCNATQEAIRTLAYSQNWNSEEDYYRIIKNDTELKDKSPLYSALQTVFSAPTKSARAVESQFSKQFDQSNNSLQQKKLPGQNDTDAQRKLEEESEEDAINSCQAEQPNATKAWWWGGGGASPFSWIWPWWSGKGAKVANQDKAALVENKNEKPEAEPVLVQASWYKGLFNAILSFVGWGSTEKSYDGQGDNALGKGLSVAQPLKVFDLNDKINLQQKVLPASAGDQTLSLTGSDSHAAKDNESSDLGS